MRKVFGYAYFSATLLSALLAGICVLASLEMYLSLAATELFLLEARQLAESLEAGLLEMQDRPADRALIELGRGAGAACKLPGSGGCVLMVCRDEAHLEQVQQACRDAGRETLRPEVAHAKPAAIPDHAFVLIVSVTLRSAEQMAQLERTFQPLASYIVANEPTTLSYELIRSDRDPNRAAIIERYADKENAYKRVHRTSAAFRAFRPVLQEMGAQLDGHSYAQTGLGFMSRREA